MRGPRLLRGIRRTRDTNVGSILGPWGEGEEGERKRFLLSRELRLTAENNVVNALGR